MSEKTDLCLPIPKFESSSLQLTTEDPANPPETRPVRDLSMLEGTAPLEDIRRPTLAGPG